MMSQCCLRTHGLVANKASVRWTSRVQVSQISAPKIIYPLYSRPVDAGANDLYNGDIAGIGCFPGNAGAWIDDGAEPAASPVAGAHRGGRQ